MTSNLAALPAATDTYLTSMSALLADDANLSAQGNLARRRQGIEQAQTVLSALLPAEPAATDRAPAFDALRAQTADQVAVQVREWDKVGALMDAGRPLGGIIARADRIRLAAIADMVETLPEVLASNDGDAIAQEVQDAIFDRLVALGDTEAVNVAAQEAAVAPVLAARGYLTATLDTGTPDYTALAAVHAADRDVYASLRDLAYRHDVAAIQRMIRTVRVAAERGGAPMPVQWREDVA